MAIVDARCWPASAVMARVRGGTLAFDRGGIDGNNNMADRSLKLVCQLAQRWLLAGARGGFGVLLLSFHLAHPLCVRAKDFERPRHRTDLIAAAVVRHDGVEPTFRQLPHGCFDTRHRPGGRQRRRYCQPKSHDHSGRQQNARPPLHILHFGLDVPTGLLRRGQRE